MNIEKAKQIPIEVILESMGLQVEKETGNDLWFKSPFSKMENTASFHITKQSGYWYCFSSATGGCNSLDLIVKLKNFTVSEALNYLQSFDSFSFQKQNKYAFERKKQESLNTVFGVKRIEHIALKQYLESRGINKYQNVTNLREVHYYSNQKRYFAIGFSNKSNGWELRSKYSKSCIIKKDITLIENESTIIKIFEGFFDYLSFLQISDEKNLNGSDYLILNSAALMTKNISILEKYRTIELYLDNDSTGEKYTKLITERFPKAKDERFKYSKYKDLNEYLCNHK